MAGFNPALNYSGTVLHSSGGISDFDSQHLALNTSGFANALDAGHFALLQQGNHLVLNFSTAVPVPEPSQWPMSLAGLAAMVALLRRRRRH